MGETECWNHRGLHSFQLHAPLTFWGEFSGGEMRNSKQHFCRWLFFFFQLRISRLVIFESLCLISRTVLGFTCRQSNLEPVARVSAANTSDGHQVRAKLIGPCMLNMWTEHRCFHALCALWEADVCMRVCVSVLVWLQKEYSWKANDREKESRGMNAG